MRYTITALVALLVLPVSVSAAELYFDPVLGTPSPGITVRVSVQLDRDINAFEGSVRYDPVMLRVASVNDGGGAVPLWIERPAATEPGAITFAGVVPGGLQHNVQQRIALFELSFEVQQAGTTVLSFEDVSVLLHSATGQADDVRTVPLTVVLDAGDVGTPLPIDDQVPPEPFAVTIERNAPVQDGTTIAVFSTRDFQSGIAGYELRERVLGVTGSWRTVESPAVLSWRWPFSIIEVRATDHAGNGRIARVVPAPLPLLVVMLVGGSVFLRRRLRGQT